MRYDIQEVQTDISAKGMNPFLQLPRPTDFSVSSLLTAGNGAHNNNNNNTSNNNTTSANLISSGLTRQSPPTNPNTMPALNHPHQPYFQAAALAALASSPAGHPHLYPGAFRLHPPPLGKENFGKNAIILFLSTDKSANFQTIKEMEEMIIEQFLPFR